MTLRLNLSWFQKFPVEFRYIDSLKSYSSFVTIIWEWRRQLWGKESWQMKGRWVVEMKLTHCTNWIAISQHWCQWILSCPPARKGQVHSWLPNISHCLPAWPKGAQISTAEIECHLSWPEQDGYLSNERVQWTKKQINSLAQNGVEMGKTKQYETNSVSPLPYSRLNVLLGLSRLEG